MRGLDIKRIGNKISQETWGTTPVPRDTSLGRLTIDVNIHKSGTIYHGSSLDQTTKGTHYLAERSKAIRSGRIHESGASSNLAVFIL
ncbi:hypothetical protein PHYBLDRAFT_150633 [Phycomyces blakesleeanus NRRL 1555(-)]|uniref:Uncharacterized protein n=1 Tax=Phycomyces blakesleeanus (strain ATCC 8743b / DSM 1359 / FGSC 10004 / NBRC 33097 / NRRL 1555) TaxID=763407 RepID=A0A162N4H8_PHYB8|nr:hypothetical protein PHYBLDRAFT_150633 [Phycomyces blakesleeanus NRRL 1555(-)]OAD68458.1 hypothetical protein PHYBLDRAFT_150633 [Phycomyces blakesleeanus NRRL 1555(-)]|eukprot:XP_018286498.1 hypothetical protein PHYBLDRAFT_150633 [Phycomyces blakesleeanus NRRL 1555(-)]